MTPEARTTARERAAGGSACDRVPEGRPSIASAARGRCPGPAAGRGGARGGDRSARHSSQTASISDRLGAVRCRRAFEDSTGSLTPLGWASKCKPSPPPGPGQLQFAMPKKKGRGSGGSKGGNGSPSPKVGSPTDVRVEANEVAAAEAGLSPDEPVTNAEGDTTPERKEKRRQTGCERKSLFSPSLPPPRPLTKLVRVVGGPPSSGRRGRGQRTGPAAPP